MKSSYGIKKLTALFTPSHTPSQLHAWSWDGVWDGVKSAVSFLIPYEDFIIIGEQLVYLVNQDWQNFDASKLAFASLGVN